MDRIYSDKHLLVGPSLLGNTIFELVGATEHHGCLILLSTTLVLVNTMMIPYHTIVYYRSGIFSVSSSPEKGIRKSGLISVLSFHVRVNGDEAGATDSVLGGIFKEALSER